MSDQVKYGAKLHGSRVLVIGGSSGIGYAVAEAVVESGGEVILSSSNANRVIKAIKSLKTAYPSAALRVTGYACNIGDESTIEANIVNLFEQSGPLDHIVYTAGDSNIPTPIAEATLEKIKSAGTIRYVGPIFVAKHAPKYFRTPSASSITLTTGIVTSRPIPNWSVIAGMRSAVIGLAQNLALDLKPIRVNAVSLGAVDTEVWSHLAPDVKEKMFAALVSKSATGRIAQPTDVAEAYLYCIRNGNVTGSVIASNGGALLI